MARRDRQDDGQGGFSLIELMIAMVATMIIAGAIFGLLTAGNTAFRREPELADRQQNIRIAMSVISDDINRAGFSLPTFQQVFMQGLDGVGPMGPNGENSDHIEMISSSDCPVLPVCASPGVNVFTTPPLSPCYHLPARVILVSLDCPSSPTGQSTSMHWAEKPGAGFVAACGANNGHVNLPPGQDPILNPPGGPPCDPDFMLVGALAHYRINIDAEGTPNLERSDVGGQDDINGNSSWQIIARGIEDLQVEYLDGNGAWADEPALPSCGVSCTNPTPADVDTITRRVRILLSARAMAPNLQGQSTSTAGDAVRGELVSEFTPKAAVTNIGMANREM